jgi:hypothetical protein
LIKELSVVELLTSFVWDIFQVFAVGAAFNNFTRSYQDADVSKIFKTKVSASPRKFEDLIENLPQ